MAVDPNALATWANAITTLRLLLAPLMIWLIPDTGQGAWPAALLWLVLCGSDFVDGHLARKHGTTRSGAFLDPLADKVLVLGAMFALVSADVFWIVPVADHRRARGGHQRLPDLRRRQGRQRPGQQDGQVQDAHPAAGRRLRHHPAHRDRCDVAVEVAAVGRRRAHHGRAACSTCGGPGTIAARADLPTDATAVL